MKNWDSKSIIEQEGTIFLNSEIFKINYLLNEYPFREGQYKEMLAYSKEVKNGKAPKNMLLKGTFATGKTSILKLYLRTMKDDYPNIIISYINCNINRTENEIFNKIYESIFDLHKKQGSHTKWLYNKCFRKLETSNKTLILGLDDIEGIKNKIELNNLFSKLLRVKELYPKVKISLIIVGHTNIELNLENKVKTVMVSLPIEFPSYNKEQIYQILKSRCEIGFYPGVISEEILKLVVDETYDRGNLRDGINILGAAGACAEIDNSSKILKKHLKLNLKK